MFFMVILEKVYLVILYVPKGTDSHNWEIKIVRRTTIIVPSPIVYSNGFYAEISNQRQMQQYKSCLKSFIQHFGSFKVP